MIYYVQTGSVATTQQANSHKQAAIRVVKKHKEIGKFIIVGTEEIKNDESSKSQMFFSTESLLDECKCCMRLVE
jgi:hypothetical protein